MVAITGLLFSLFYILTALATIAYFRRRIMAKPVDSIMLGILPLAAAVFLAWIIIKSLMNAPGSQRWSMLGIVLAMAFIPDQRTPLIFGLISLGILLLSFGVRVFFGRPTHIATLAMEPHQYEEL